MMVLVVRIRMVLVMVIDDSVCGKNKDGIGDGD